MKINSPKKNLAMWYIERFWKCSLNPCLMHRCVYLTIHITKFLIPEEEEEEDDECGSSQQFIQMFMRSNPVVYEKLL
jgi:hypothetical protein